MAFPDAAAQAAASTSPSQLDPSNPAALGYEPEGEDFARVREAARRDPDLERAFQGQLNRETARFGAWARSWRRRGGGGAGWSGLADPFTPARPQALLDRAQAAVQRRRAWSRSTAGALARRLAEAEAAAQALGVALAEARAALDRAGPPQGTGRAASEFH